MGVVYFSIIPTFEPSRYCKCWIVCFYYRYTFESVEQLDEMTKQYINWYNYVRPHSTNNYMTPMEFRYRA